MAPQDAGESVARDGETLPGPAPAEAVPAPDTGAPGTSAETGPVSALRPAAPERTAPDTPPSGTAAPGLAAVAPTSPAPGDAAAPASDTASPDAPADPDRAWAEFAAPRDGMAFLLAWFRLIVAELPGVQAAVLMLQQGGSFAPAARFPEAAAPEVFAPLIELARRARPDQSETLLQPRPGGGRLVGYPISIDGHLHGLLLWASADPSPGALALALRRLHWGSGWLHSLLLRQQIAQSDSARARMAAVLAVLAAMEDQPGLDMALRALADGAAQQLSADRAGVFLLRGRRLRLRALSGAVEPQHRARELASLTAAAEEARLQGAALALPAAEGGLAILAASRAHARRSGTAAMLALPMRAGSRVLGALTLERMSGAAFTEAERELAEAIAAGGAAALAPKIAEHRWVSGRLRWHLGRFLGRLFGPRRPTLKLVTLLAITALALLALLPVPQRITTRAVVQGVEERLVTAPFDGFIASAALRAGDRVAAGTPLAALKDDDLRLDLQANRGEIAALEQEARAALAKGDRAAQAETEARIAGARAAGALIEARLARTRLLAPIDGVIVEGDLSQRLGAPVATGDVLFRIAADRGYKAMLEIGEYDVGALAEGMPGALALAGISGPAIPVVLGHVGPVAQVSDAGARNVFRAEAELPEAAAARLLPGLEGVAKIEAGRARLGQVLARPIWLRLRHLAWRWTP